ncbi:MAG TPA: hypothetical protein VNB50_04490 [Gaiellaceae bacterium]|jgi:hypothetical protein|nr:hypothetical protein [Gaiellaceae bacterium]
MLTKLWRRFREGNARHERLKGEAAIEKALREHEQEERERARLVGLPPGRSNTDWTYVDWTP